MQQHPVPQNISSYEFRLIGDMTLKQFLQLLGGGVVGFLFFLTNLPSIIKWFFIIVSVLLAIGFAFMPLEGRSLDKWLLAFIRSIYKPTQFHWKKTPKLPDYLSSKPLKKTSSTTQSKTTKAKDQKKPDHETKLSKHEAGRVNQINQLFSKSPAPTPIQKPTPTPPTQPSSTTRLASENVAGVVKKPPPPPKEEVSSPSIETTPIGTVKITQQQPSTNESPKSNIENQPKPNLSRQAVIQGTITPTPPKQDDSVVTAKLNPDLPFPSLPETKNTLVGMVFTKDKKIVDNAIIEIQNQSQHTVRATKTNKIGQFFLATPLEKGSYFIKTEKEGLSFSVISIQLEDKIYPPIEIQAN